MCSKIITIFFRVILQGLIAFLNMCSNVGDSMDLNEKIEEYKFQPYRYEEIVPNKKSKTPKPRSGHRIAADSVNFYSFGGYNPLLIEDEATDEENRHLIESYPLFQELWKFNFASKSWSRYPNSLSLPLELASNAVWLHRNLLMVYGGTGSPFGFRCSNQLYICKVNDERADMEEIQAGGKYPLPLYGQALVYHNDYLYTIGGTSGLSYTCDIHRINLKTFQWTEVYVAKGHIFNGEPKGRYRHEVGFDGENIFVFGGGTAGLVYGMDELPTFSLEMGRWHSTKTLKDTQYGTPPARRCHGAVQINVDGKMQVFITGGHDGDNIFDDLWRFDLRTYQWTFFPAVPPAQRDILSRDGSHRRG